MRLDLLIIRTIWHFRKSAITVALGMAIGMIVITGALVTGDSVRTGLQRLVGIRLGQVDMAISAGERYLTDSLASRLSSDLGIPAAAILELNGSVSAAGGTLRLPQVRILGIDPSFQTVLGSQTFNLPEGEEEAVISDNLAERLGLVPGDEMLVRIHKPGPVPIDAPFVSSEEDIVTLRMTVGLIAGKEQHGRFHLQNTQTAPFNIFVIKRHLQKAVDLQNQSNLILLSGQGTLLPEELQKSLNAHRTLADAGLNLQKHPVSGEWVLRTPRVFFDPPTLQAIGSASDSQSRWFSYFINEFQSGERSTPYSFVSTLPGNRIKPGEMIINRWLADDLQIRTGDSVTIRYFTVGTLRNLTEQSARFRVSSIIGMDDPFSDRLLMPEIPGLSDAGNCRDWEAGIPIDLDKIRDHDEAYWTQYRGTPKAFLHPDDAVMMWQNRFGSFTQVRFDAQADSSLIAQRILDKLSPVDQGIRITRPLQEGMVAASSGVDFSGLFLGLSFFLIAGGVILTILLIRLNLESRQEHMGTLRALGWPVSRIRIALLGELSLLSLLGVLLGLALTFVYTILIFKALNGVWNSIVLTDTLKPVFKPLTLLAGGFAGFLLSTVTAWFTLNRHIRQSTHQLLRKQTIVPKRTGHLVLTAIWVIGLSAALTTGYGLVRIGSVGPVWFFMAGTLLMLSILVWIFWLLVYRGPKSTHLLTLQSLSIHNLYRNSRRSLSVILLFSIGIFMVLTVGANRKTASRSNIGTGEFDYFMESTVPIPDDLNKPEVRAKYGLEAPATYVQMKKLNGDDASCLNLNLISNPPVLGIPGGSMTGRFAFTGTAIDADGGDPWSLLEHTLPGNALPAIADQTVIQWGLGRALGDTLKYVSERGDTLPVVLVAGLANSIYQGHVLISESQFMRHWPSISGTRVLLIQADNPQAGEIESDIGRVFRDYGVDLKKTEDKLAEFNAIENTYLSIFLVMGALAMLLGTIGLGVILLRNLQERRKELDLLRATGFSRTRILRLIFGEYFILLISGTLAGGIPAMVSIIPQWIHSGGEVSGWFLAAILAILILHGVLWIAGITWGMVKRTKISG